MRKILKAIWVCWKCLSTNIVYDEKYQEYRCGDCYVRQKF